MCAKTILYIFVSMAYSFDVLTFFVPPVTRVMSLSNPKFLRLSDFDQLEGTGVTAWT